MKVLMLVQTVDSGSSAGFIVHWIRSLAKNVDYLTVISYRYSSREKLPKNVKIVKVPGDNFISRTYNLGLLTFEESLKADVIFSHILEVFGIISGIVGTLTRRKSYFWYCQGYDLSHHYLAKLALWFPSVIFTCGERVKQRYILEVGSWIKNKTFAVGHGIDLLHYKLGKPGPKIHSGKPVKIIYAGRIAPIKDLMTLLRAVEKLSSQGYPISLDIHGGWGILNHEKLEYRDLILSKIKQINSVKEIIRFANTGSHSYATNYQMFKSGHIFVMPTLSTSLDVVYIEALACGIPALGSDIGYPFMTEKFSRLVFRAGDSTDLAKKLIWLINNPTKAYEITKQAKLFVEANFDLDKLMAKIAKIMEPKFYYITNSRFPTEKAHGIQIAKNCEALIEVGINLVLVIPKRINHIILSSKDYYGLRETIPIKIISNPDFLVLTKNPLAQRIGYLLQSITFNVSVWFFSLKHYRETIFTRDFYLPLFCFRQNRVIWEVHELPKTNFGKKLFIFIAGRCRKIISVNQAVNDYFLSLGIPKEKLALLPNGVDEKFFQISQSVNQAKKILGFPKTVKAVVYAGALYKRKGVDLLLEARKFLPKNFQVYLFGGPRSEWRRFQSRKVYVKSLPYNQMPLVYRAADVLVLPNVSWDPYASDQTSPIKLFEYLVSGKPVVAASVPSIKRLVKKSNVTFFIPDNPVDLARTIAKVASHRRIKKITMYDLKTRAQDIKKLNM